MRNITLSLLAGLTFLAGCHGMSSSTTQPEAIKPAKAAMANLPAIRIDAGATKNWTDPSGHEWLADTGFTGGDVVERDASTKIENTDIPEIYRTEHYSMTQFDQTLPNGNYTVKLHFAETSTAVSAAGERVFTMNVGGHEIKDFDVLAKAGGADKAYVESVPVTITGGKLTITFTEQTQHTEINGIEIIPAP